MPSTVSVFNGPEPEIVHAKSADDETKALAQWIKDLIKRGYQPNQIAILGRTKRLGTDAWFFDEITGDSHFARLPSRPADIG